MCGILSELATKIWAVVAKNNRAQSATTIAVIEGEGGPYCTANDVSFISQDASALAENKGISPIGTDYISIAGAGFHAEMWAVQNALASTPNVGQYIQKVGASRACCKYCTAVLTIYNIDIEQSSEDLYQSWINPLTTGDNGNPRADYQDKQRKNIPDYRRNGKNYWFIDLKGHVSEEPMGMD